MEKGEKLLVLFGHLKRIKEFTRYKLRYKYSLVEFGDDSNNMLMENDELGTSEYYFQCKKNLYFLFFSTYSVTVLLLQIT